MGTITVRDSHEIGLASGQGLNQSLGGARGTTKQNKMKIVVLPRSSFRPQSFALRPRKWPRVKERAGGVVEKFNPLVSTHPLCKRRRKRKKESLNLRTQQKREWRKESQSLLVYFLVMSQHCYLWNSWYSRAMPSTTSFVLVTVGFRLLVNLLPATHEQAEGYLIRFCIKHSMSGGKGNDFCLLLEENFLKLLLKRVSFKLGEILRESQIK